MGYKIAGFWHRKSEKRGDGNGGELAVNTAIHLTSIQLLFYVAKVSFQ